jgi:hypothetical protein
MNSNPNEHPDGVADNDSIESLSEAPTVIVPNNSNNNYYCEQLGEPLLANNDQQAIAPLSQDVILGRGRRYDMHPGNMHYRALIEFHVSHYNETSSRFHKSNVTNGILNSITEKGGRFLYRDKRTGLWAVLDNEEKVRAKISQALRFKHRQTEAQASPASIQRQPSTPNQMFQQHNLNPPTASRFGINLDYLRLLEGVGASDIRASPIPPPERSIFNFPDSSGLSNQTNVGSANTTDLNVAIPDRFVPRMIDQSSLQAFENYSLSGMPMFGGITASANSMRESSGSDDDDKKPSSTATSNSVKEFTRFHPGSDLHRRKDGSNQT